MGVFIFITGEASCFLRCTYTEETGEGRSEYEAEEKKGKSCRP